MLQLNFLNAENMKRVNYAQIGVAVVAGIICCYIGFNTLAGMSKVWGIESSLRQAKKESSELSRQASGELRKEAKQPVLDNGGVDAFTLRVSGWAKTYHVLIDSITPEGAPSQSEIANGTTKLGLWNVSKVRIKGKSDFMKLMGFIKEIKDTKSPVKLDSFVFESSQEANSGVVNFDLVLTVYEKKNG